MCSEGGRALSRPSCLSIPTQREVYGLRSSKIHTLLLLALLLEGNRGQKGKKNQSAAGEARGGADTMLGLKPDTRRGYGVAARPRTLPPALPDTRSGNAHS